MSLLSVSFFLLLRSTKMSLQNLLKLFILPFFKINVYLIQIYFQSKCSKKIIIFGFKY